MKVGFLGTGAWASALANVVSDNGHNVWMFGICKEEIDDINLNHQNSRYFPNVNLNENIKATLVIEEAVLDADVVVVATPSSQLRVVLPQIEKVINSKPIILNVAKGFDSVTRKRISNVIKESIDPNVISGVVSLIGPSFASEVVERLHTAISAVSTEEKAAKKIQELFSNSYFRVYTNNDEIGAEIGAGLKNVIAIASGILEGLNYHDNTRAALITRGIAEIARYGVIKGADYKTFLGLTGIGDLFLTCSSTNSRNYSFGVEIGKHDSAKEVLENNKKTVEGVFACSIIHEDALQMGIDMPITNAVYEIVYEGKKPSDVLKSLMNRSLKHE